MRKVRVIYHCEDGTWWAESPDVAGWTVAGDSFSEVQDLSHEGLPFFTEEELSIEDVMQTLRSGNPYTEGYGFSIEVTERFQKPLADRNDRKNTGGCCFNDYGRSSINGRYDASL